jgi:predicted nucleic acid-binding protein
MILSSASATGASPRHARTNLSPLPARFRSSSTKQTPGRALTTVLNLARSKALSAYDASYLELATRRGVPLATKDDALAKAAQRMGVTLLPTA